MTAPGSSPVGDPLCEATARRIRMVVLDVDGVMTDGGIHVGATEKVRTD